MTDGEIAILLAYEAASDEGRQRIMACGRLFAHVLRPGEAEAIGEELADIFIHSPPGRPMKAIKRDCWRIIARHRLTASQA